MSLGSIASQWRIKAVSRFVTSLFGLPQSSGNNARKNAKAAKKDAISPDEVDSTLKRRPRKRLKTQAKAAAPTLACGVL
jgi:hypothetical protein